MKRLLPLLLGLCLPGLALAADDKAPANNAATPQSFITEHRADVGGQRMAYKVVAGETVLQNDKDKDIASIFSVSYFRTDVKSPKARPVTFVFNGGPGSASLWLHLGIFGPKRVVVPGDARDDGAAPFTLVDNQYSLLDVSDLVFIDPVGTGFSRALGESQGKDFWGVREDAESLAEFIRIWLTENGRWNSPKYLAGESYGTTRAVALLDELQGGWTDIAVNGVMLISSVLDFSHSRFQNGNNQSYIGFLPTMAATAFYHNKVSETDRSMGLAAFVEASRQFALGDYATALLLGNRLDKDKYDAVLKQLARFTGLSSEYLARVNLRVSGSRYTKELLRDRSQTVGRLDSRYTGRDYDDGGERTDNDPSGYGIDAAYTAAIHEYLFGELGVKIKRPFNVLSVDVNRTWNWQMGNGGAASNVNVAPLLGKAQRENSDLRVFVANGYFDFATPFFATENTFADNGISPDGVTMTYYEAGHMMYIEPASLEALARDLSQFYKEGKK